MAVLVRAHLRRPIRGHHKLSPTAAHAPAPALTWRVDLGYLIGSQDVASYLQQATAHDTEYNGYSLIAGTPDRLYVLSNRSSGVTPIPAACTGSVTVCLTTRGRKYSKVGGFAQPAECG